MHFQVLSGLEQLFLLLSVLSGAGVEEGFIGLDRLQAGPKNGPAFLGGGKRGVRPTLLIGKS
jgi:hypothetical protein